jgi:HSP20 family protein
MSSLVLRGRRDPFAEFDALARLAFGGVPGRATRFVPAAEVVRDGTDAVVRIEVPGLDPERDVTVEVDRGYLVVRGERRDERAEQERNGRILREVRYGAFRRAFALPEHVTDHQVSASYDAGILTVRVAGAYSGSTPKRIPVTGGSAAIEAEPAADTADGQAA